MKIKLTTLLFGLLLAVGWTGSAFAQSATYSAESIKDLTYTWTDANGTSHDSPYVKLVTKDDGTQYYESELVTDPYQMYGLLRGVYMEKQLPGPLKSAYKADGSTRERDVYYGGIDGGWNIGVTKGNLTSGNIRIRVYNYNRSYPMYISSIKVMSGNTLITQWEKGQTSLPTGWSSSATAYTNGNGELYLYTRTQGDITIRNDSFDFGNYSEIQVYITARNPIGDLLSSNYMDYLGDFHIDVTYPAGYNELRKDFTSDQPTEAIYGFCGATTSIATDGTYTPQNEGYTAVMVSVKDDAQIEPENWNINGCGEFRTKDDIIAYFKRNVNFMRLLTDGIRVGDGYKVGTVFNCDATVNKFFILGKGQARKKGQEVLTQISNGNYLSYAGEEVVFKQMFEEFSPTTGGRGDQITDFYSELMKGNVYNVVHDCASVIQNGHQFSLSGNSATPEPYSFTGLNFFIPDYRLMYWVGRDSIQQSSWGYTYYEYVDCDGRDMNALYTTTGRSIRNVSPYYANFAQYNQQYAPQIGLYRITLDASTEKSADYDFDDPTKRNYDITLHWVSSLDEMAGRTVDQIYTVYTWDEEGNRIELRPIGVKFFDAEGNELTGDYSNNPFVVTQVTYQWPQKATSQIFEYQVMGTPNDTEHPGFVAWSNTDYVVIPGWNDFLALKRNHYESDFVVNEEKNYYRNFMTVTNENEDNALTLERIKNGEDTYTLYRYDVANPNNMNPVADIIFEIEGDPEEAKYVQFELSYTYKEGDNIISYGSQDQLRPAGQENKYDLTSMGVKTQGDLVIHGNGDLVIEPNGTTVNFHSIVVKSGNTVVTSWDGSGNLPSEWKTSPGAVWSTFEGKYYLEGQGYIYIPSTVLGNYQNITVTINASGDPGSVSRITVNDVMKRIANGNAGDYTWTAEEVATDNHDKDGMIRMGGLPIVDQFSASTAKNNHPEKYGYELIYKKGTDDEKRSSKVEVPVQHTKSKVNGFYTEDEVKNDTDRELTTDVLTADVTLTLSDDNASIYHYILLSDAKNVVPEVDDARTDYVSYLQQRNGFTYREMNENSPLWVEDNDFGWPAGEREYFNETEKLTGSYGDYKTYVPVVETTGFDRRWYEVEDSQYGDRLHNTYGSPVWKTSVGKVDNLSADAQPQQGWNTTWKNGDEDCRLYMLDNVKADGYLPSTEVTNIEYEPYMFRIFVESKNGNLRHFKYVTDKNGNRVIAADEGSTTGPWCVWSEYLTLDENGDPVDNTTNGVTFGTTDDGAIHFEKIKVDRTYPTTEEWTFDEENAIFGAVNALANENELIAAKDLTVYVRFYYRSTGKAIETGRFMLRADGDETPEYYAAEGDSQAKQTPTGVSEIRYHGEVVSTTYYNVQGIKSDKPFDGVNIVVTRYSDGATSISKVVK
jgi:hypothetical protein